MSNGSRNIANNLVIILQCVVCWNACQRRKSRRLRKMIAIAAGSLDNSVDLQTIGHIWLSQKANYHTISDDLPKFDKGWPEITGSKVE